MTRQIHSARGVLLTLVLLAILGGILAESAVAEPYDRTRHFGSWLDFDGDGLDARQEMLAGSIVTGRGWITPYRGRLVTDASLVEVDHIVPLKWAWEHGASAWDMARRQEFANDPANLAVVTARANRSKGARGPNEWMPANVAIWHAYLDWWDRILRRYGLGYSPAEAESVACLRRFATRHELGAKVLDLAPC